MYTYKMQSILKYGEKYNYICLIIKILLILLTPWSCCKGILEDIGWIKGKEKAKVDKNEKLFSYMYIFFGGEEIRLN